MTATIPTPATADAARKARLRREREAFQAQLDALRALYSRRI